MTPVQSVVLRSARVVSIVGHPFATVTVMLIAAGSRFGGRGEALRAWALVLLFAVLPVAVLMVRQVKRGHWSNVDASHVRERPLLYAVGGAGILVLALVLLMLDPQSFALRGTVGTIAMIAFCAAITPWLKVSLHMAFAALSASVLVVAGSAAGWFLLPFIPLLGWSRLVLSRHRIAEVAAGTLIGAATGIAIHFV